MKRPQLVALISLVSVLSACAGNDGLPSAEAAPVDAGASVSATFVKALAADAATLESKVVGLARALSANQYPWTPGEGVLSVRDVLMHVAAYNYYYPSFAGAPIPSGVGVTTDYATVGEYEASLTERDAIIEALEVSFTHLRASIDTVVESDLNRPVQVFGNPSTVPAAWMGTLTHIHEHLGQLIAYARMNGVTPPWSR